MLKDPREAVIKMIQTYFINLQDRGEIIHFTVNKSDPFKQIRICWTSHPQGVLIHELAVSVDPIAKPEWQVRPIIDKIEKIVNIKRYRLRKCEKLRALIKEKQYGRVTPREQVFPFSEKI